LNKDILLTDDHIQNISTEFNEVRTKYLKSIDVVMWILIQGFPFIQALSCA